MRSKHNKLLFILAATLMFVACKKQEDKVYFLGGTAPTLSASQTDSIPLSYANADQEAVKLWWTNPNYQFNNGPSSQDVSYTLEIDTVGSNFTNPNREVVSISKDLSFSISNAQLNDYMLNQLALVVGIPHNLQFRITAAIAKSAEPIMSNTLQLQATPYAIPPKVTPPVDGKLFLVGSATAGGWANPVPVPSQQFTQDDATHYEITINLDGGQEYLFLPVNGDWSHKYAVKDKTLAGLSSGGDFGYDYNDNFPGPSATGTYTIKVDFQRGKFTVTQ
ncbi:MAG TPA: SusE domain-containing protein, partial [Puia sp.]|nr:SusE domain-containing protein [Puia sp.]